MKNPARVIVAALSLVISTESAFAYRPLLSIRGGIAGSCAQWSSDRAQESKGAANHRKDAVIAYLSGLVNAFGTNFFEPPGVIAIDDAAIFKWVDDDCRRHPQQRLDRAADKLFFERTKSQ